MIKDLCRNLGAPPTSLVTEILGSKLIMDLVQILFCLLKLLQGHFRKISCCARILNCFYRTKGRNFPVALKTGLQEREHSIDEKSIFDIFFRIVFRSFG